MASKIQKMTTVLYRMQHKESIGLILDPEKFDHCLVERDKDLDNFLNEICNIFLPKGWERDQKVEKQKKIIAILYLIASIRNMQISTFKVELGAYLDACGLSSVALNTLSNAGIATTYKTLYNNKKRISAQHPGRVKIFFDDNVCNLLIIFYLIF